MAMPHRETSVGGRSSRASSIRSRGVSSQRTTAGSDMFSAAAPGVLSMLKTSTDVGDIGSLPFNNGRLPVMPRPTHRRRTNIARLSDSSNHTSNSYTASQLSPRESYSPAWDSVSAVSEVDHGRHGTRGSLTSLQTMRTGNSHAPASRMPNENGIARAPPGVAASLSQDGRSYSLTQPQPSFTLKPHRSAASLRSTGTIQLPPQRPQYAYPTRLKRPGYRSASPASDSGRSAFPPSFGMPPGTGDSWNVDNQYASAAHGSNQNHHHHHHQYQHAGAMSGPMQRSAVQPAGPRAGRPIHRPPMPSYHSDYTHSTSSVVKHVPGRAQKARGPSTNIPAASIDHDGYNMRGLAMGNNMPHLPFQSYGSHVNEPPRVYTPHNDSVPSSDQSSSAPPSSNPPTPQNASSMQIGPGPAFVDQALGEFPDTEFEQITVERYLNYTQKAETFELDAAEPAAAELDAGPQAATGGFVRRIKNLLEDRAAQDVIKTSEKLAIPQCFVPVAFTGTTQQSEHIPDAVELPTQMSPRSSVYEPVELEAPAKLTRALVKANTAPSSSEQETLTSISSNQCDTIKHEEGDLAVVSTHQSSTSNAAASSSRCAIRDEDASSVEIAEATRATKAFEGPETLDLFVSSNAPVNTHVLVTPMHLDDATAWSTQQRGSATDGMVSLIHADEEITRNSVVSPMKTQTLDFAETDRQSQMPGSFPEDEKAPDYQASSLSFPLSASGSSNRFSIPPDLSLLNEPTPTSGVVTDVAVRLSIPQTTEQGRPQLISVNAAVEPAVGNPELCLKSSHEKHPPRKSFSDTEHIAPLQIKKMDAALAGTDMKQDNIESADLSSFIRRSFPRRQSIWPGERNDTKRMTGDSTTDFRFPGMKLPAGRLPGLKEESQEDMSVKSFKTSVFKMASPVSMTRTRNAQSFLESCTEKDDIVKSSYLASRLPRMTLSELRNLPSLNFSRTDLIDKLNEALEIRSSRSLDIIRRPESQGIYCPLPIRPSSTETLRERYTSFFAKPEDFKVPEPTECESSDDDDCSSIQPHDDPCVHEQKPGKDDSCETAQDVGETTPVIVLPTVPQTRPASGSRSMSRVGRSLSPSVRTTYRPMSPEDFLNVASDANRLSIPSVAALTDRLSELLPSIKHLQFDSAIANDRAVSDTIDAIHHLGPKPHNMDLVRTSTGLRQMAAVADDIVTNGTHDSAVVDAKGSRLMKELPPLPEDIEKLSLSESGLDKNTTLSTEAFTVETEPEVPRPALLKIRSLNDIDVSTDVSQDELLSSACKRSGVLSTQSTRPWNVDENYPWSGNTINITFPAFPAPVMRRNSSASNVLRRSKASSNAPSESSSVPEPRSKRRASPLASDQTPTETMYTTLQPSKASKRSIIGSFSRRIGLGQRTHSKSTLQSSVLLEPARPTKPGDRYPSTALLPPTAFNIDEVRSFFSDSTSDGSNKRGSFRRHINTLRARLPGPSAVSGSCKQSIDREHPRPDDYRSATPCLRDGATLMVDDRFTEPTSPQNYDGVVGMGKMEYRVKQVGERLRHIWLKGSELLRSFSQRTHQPVGRRLHKERERDEWLADSLYSGT